MPTITVDVKVLLSVLTSKPVGGVIKMPAVMLAPDTLKVPAADAVPYVVLKADKVPVAEIVGVAEDVVNV